MAPTVADLVKFYADAPPPKKDSLADLEAHLDALRPSGYRSPFKFEPSSLSSLAAASFGTTKYGPLGEHTSAADALTLPGASEVSSLYQAHHATGPVLIGPTPLSELLTERYGQSPGLIGAAKFLYDAGEALNRTMEAWRPQLEKFGAFVGELPTRLERTLKALRSTRPLDPYGNPVPLHNAGLYVMARWAYRGDYWEAKAEFLNEIGADESADNVLYLEELLRPTFKPSRLDLREPWEQRNPLEARRWLRKSLGDLKRKNGREKRIVLPYEENDEQARSDLFAFAEEESERAREAEIHSILPERQHQILMLLVEERKQAEIAELLGIGLSTVKTHAGRLQNNPDLLRALRP